MEENSSGPACYATNEVPPTSGFGTSSLNVVSDEICDRARKTASEHHDWLGSVMLQSGDMPGALLASLTGASVRLAGPVTEAGVTCSAHASSFRQRRWLDSPGGDSTLCSGEPVLVFHAC